MTIRDIQPQFFLSSFLSNWHLQLQLLDYIITLDTVGINFGKFVNEKHTLIYIINNIIGLPILNSVYPSKTNIELYKIPIVLFLSTQVNIVYQPLQSLSVLLQLIFNSKLWSQLGKPGKDLNFVGKALIYPSLLGSTINIIFEMFWQFLIGMQVSFFYFYFTKNDNHTWINKSDYSDYQFASYRYIAGWDNLFGSLGKVIASGLNLFVEFMKGHFALRVLFKIMFDPAWKYKEDYYGIGIFYLDKNKEEQIDSEDIEGLDDIDQEGFIDVLEAILSSLKWWKVSGTLFHVTYHLIWPEGK